MTFRELLGLDVGDEVRWNDPDNDECGGVYHIQEIVTDSGRVEAEDSVLVITDGDGSCAEVYASELS